MSKHTIKLNPIKVKYKVGKLLSLPFSSHQIMRNLTMNLLI